MLKMTTAAAALSLTVSLTACGDSCDSLQAKAEEIGREIQANPQTAWDRAEELQELTEKMMELECGG